MTLFQLVTLDRAVAASVKSKSDGSVRDLLIAAARMRDRLRG